MHIHTHWPLDQVLWHQTSLPQGVGYKMGLHSELGSWLSVQAALGLPPVGSAIFPEPLTRLQGPDGVIPIGSENTETGDSRATAIPPCLKVPDAA
jgi:hypothetical protein